ncbi:MAG TPA: hypothetical protein VLR91_03190 [Thermodesulfobacteriota bacterium]|nr:hypothetical protein [Thermodesulfobacteriota bacterium]
MSEHSQLKLFPMTVQEILSVIPLSINHAELLYHEGLISFQPEPAKKLQPKEQAELFFVGTLAKNPIPLEAIKYLLQSLRAPYAYSFKDLFFDWIQGTWRIFPAGGQPDKEIKEGRISLDWASVDPLAHRVFTLWPGQPELIWVRESWGLILKYGLADYANDFERWGVLFRFLALAGIYFDFCHLAWNRVNRPDYETLGKELGLGLLQVVMLLGQDALLEQVNDEEELFRVGMKSLADQARLEIVPALIRGYGGLKSLYEGFRRSRQSEPSPADNEQIIQFSERDALRWLEEGCRVFR